MLGNYARGPCIVENLRFPGGKCDLTGFQSGVREELSAECGREESRRKRRDQIWPASVMASSVISRCAENVS